MSVISEIEVQKKKKDRFNLFLDGKFYAGVSTDTLVKHGLYKGKGITSEQLNQLIFDEVEQKVFDRAANLLLKALKGEKEVRQKIKDWLYKSENKELVEKPELIVENVIQRLKDIKLIDDERYAEAFVNDRNEFRPRSERMIEYELGAKGIDKDIIKRVIGDSGMDDKRTAEEVLFKKFRSKFIEKGNQKKIAFLQGKGFDWDTISDLIIEVD